MQADLAVQVADGGQDLAVRLVRSAHHKLRGLPGRSPTSLSSARSGRIGTYELAGPTHRVDQFIAVLERRDLAQTLAVGSFQVDGHALRNLAEGWGGPSSPTVLWDPRDVADEVSAASLTLERCEEVVRVVDDEDGEHEAIDLLVDARRIAA